MGNENTQTFVGRLQENTQDTCYLLKDVLYSVQNIISGDQMSNSEVLAGLEEKECEINLQIERLKADLLTIQRTKELFSGDSKNQLEMKAIVKQPNDEQLKPTQAIRELFDTYPTRKWYPGQIRDRLETIRDAGKLKTNYKNLLYAVHSILREMAKREEIEKSDPDNNRRRWYRKKQ